MHQAASHDGPPARRASDSTVDAAADRRFCLATPKSL
jgi:hypothetical protein